MKFKWFILGVAIVSSLIFVYSFNGTKMDSNMVKYNGNNLMVSVDGKTADTLPTNGTYYLANYSCKSSNTKLSWDSNSYQLSVSNGNKSGGVTCYLEFESTPKLADMKVGSYVEYTGNNGCSDNHCSGDNANYVSSTDMGYCDSDNYKFTSNGFRIAYIKNGSAYLVSAGALECLSGTSYADVRTSLSSAVLKYCNTDYLYGGVCNSNSVWNIGVDDFKSITGSTLSDSSCYGDSGNKKCGYSNDLIDNGSSYWYDVSDSSNAFMWNASKRMIGEGSISSYGVRPILRMDTNVIVVGGNGTSGDPYRLANNTFFVDASDKSKVQLSLVGEGVRDMCISVNTSVCTNYISFVNSYVLDLSSEASGENVIYVYFRDTNGRIIANANRKVMLS